MPCGGGFVYRNVAEGIDPPRPRPREIQPPDAEGVWRILGLAEGTPYRAVLHFMAFTGCRWGEAVALRWVNIDLDRGVASITETAQRLQGKGIVFQSTNSAAGHRGVDLDTATVDMLRAHRGQQLLYKSELGAIYQDQGLLFPGRLGGPLDPSVLTRNFEKLAEKAGLTGIRLHDLHHGHAAGLIRVNTNPKPESTEGHRWTA